MPDYAINYITNGNSSENFIAKSKKLKRRKFKGELLSSNFNFSVEIKDKLPTKLSEESNLFLNSRIRYDFTDFSEKRSCTSR